MAVGARTEPRLARSTQLIEVIARFPDPVQREAMHGGSGDRSNSVAQCAMHSPPNEAWKAAAAKELQDRHSIAATAFPERERTRMCAASARKKPLIEPSAYIAARATARVDQEAAVMSHSRQTTDFGKLTAIEARPLL